MDPSATHGTDPASLVAAAVGGAAAALLILDGLGRLARRALLLRGVSRRPWVRGVVVAATVFAALGRGPARAATPPPQLRLERPVPPATGGTASPAETPTGEAYRVQPGDSLWGIAARLLGAGEGRQPGSADVDRLWRRIYDANRGLIGPDPDLIHPGQQLTIPREA